MRAGRMCVRGEEERGGLEGVVRGEVGRRARVCGVRG